MGLMMWWFLDYGALWSLSYFLILPLTYPFLTNMQEACLAVQRRCLVLRRGGDILRALKWRLQTWAWAWRGRWWPQPPGTEGWGTDTESSGEDKDSDSMEDTGHYSVNDESQVHDRSEEEEEEEEEHPRRRVQRKRANRDQDSSDDERALEDWVSSETSALPRPRWQALPAPSGSGSWVQVPALCMRLVGQESLCSVSACSMGLKAILAVSILCTLTSGTWLASGAATWKWWSGTGCGGSQCWTLRAATRAMSSRWGQRTDWQLRKSGMS